MATLEEYANKYETVAFERTDGILQVTFHSGDGSLLWGEPSHRELGHAFADIGSDVENRAVILTGTGDNYCAEFEPGRSSRRMPKDCCLTCWTLRCQLSAQSTGPHSSMRRFRCCPT